MCFVNRKEEISHSFLTTCGTPTARKFSKNINSFASEVHFLTFSTSVIAYFLIAVFGNFQIPPASLIYLSVTVNFETEREKSLCDIYWNWLGLGTACCMFP